MLFLRTQLATSLKVQRRSLVHTFSFKCKWMKYVTSFICSLQNDAVDDDDDDNY